MREADGGSLCPGGTSSAPAEGGPARKPRPRLVARPPGKDKAAGEDRGREGGYAQVVLRPVVASQLGQMKSSGQEPGGSALIYAGRGGRNGGRTDLLIVGVAQAGDARRGVEPAAGQPSLARQSSLPCPLQIC